MRAEFAEAFTLEDDADADSEEIVARAATADVGALVVGDFLEIGTVPAAEYRRAVEVLPPVVVSATDSTVKVLLDAPLTLGYSTTPGPVQIRRLDVTAPSVDDASVGTATGGGAVVFVDDRNGNFDVPADLVVVGTTDTEMRRIGELTELRHTPGAVRRVSGRRDRRCGCVREQPNACRRTRPRPPTSSCCNPDEAAGLVIGQRVVVDPTGTPETFAIQNIDTSTDTLTITPPVGPGGHASGDDVVPVAKRTTAEASVGAACSRSTIASVSRTERCCASARARARRSCPLSLYPRCRTSHRIPATSSCSPG